MSDRTRSAAMSPDAAYALLLSRGWLAEQPASLQRAVFQRGRLRHLESGAAIFQTGDQPNGIYAVVSGQIKLAYMLPEGREVVLWAAEPGFWFGVRDLVVPQSVRYAAAVAGSAALIFHLPKNSFNDLVADDAGCAVNFAGIMAHNLLLALRYISEVLSQPATVRVARLLALVCETSGTGKDGIYEVKLSHQDLAAMLSLSRVTIGKALHVLEAERLISLRYGRIAVPDIGRLAVR